MALVSIVIPVYNEEENIDAFYKALVSAITDIPNSITFEFIFIDNNSYDKTRQKVITLIDSDPRIRYIKLSRNFGYQLSIWTGYSMCRGDAAIEIDADLEDDPKFIKKMISYWQSGYMIVYGIRKNRNESKILEASRKIYYRILASISSDEIPVDAGDFMLLDRKILDVLQSVNDPNLYIRGFVFSLGFKKFGFQYNRNSRLGGKSKFNLVRLISLAINAFVRHSIVPLRLSSFVGAGLSFIFVLAAAVFSFIKPFFGNDWPPGFATLVVLQLFSLAMISFFIGILGEYIWRIYQIVKNDPMTLVEFEIDFLTKASSKKDINSLE